MSQSTAVLDPGLELPDEVHEHLARRYGGDAREVVAIAAADARLARPVVAGLPDLLAEAVFTARRGQVGSVADFLIGWSSDRTFREAEAWTRLRCPP